MNPLHPVAGPPGATCGGCAWYHVGGRGRAVGRCRRSLDARVAADWPACARHEAPLDCTRCGACCREAYHRVELSRRDPFGRLHPDRVSVDDGHLVVTRTGERCGCLRVEDARFTCDVYADRPRTCRDFTLGSANCLEARRRVGLSR